MTHMPEKKAVGSIEVICGPMFSGKTEELIRRLRRAMIARQRVIVYKAAIDNRFDVSAVVSHSQHKLPSVAVNNAQELQAHLLTLPQATVVGIDEAQFFDDDLIPLVEEAAMRGIRVIVAGLDQDYLGKPFNPMPYLLAIADMVTKQTAVCIVCGAPATKTQRVFKGSSTALSDSKKQIQVGAADCYEARCRGCYLAELAPACEAALINTDDMLLSSSKNHQLV